MSTIPVLAALTLLKLSCACTGRWTAIPTAKAWFGTGNAIKQRAYAGALAIMA